MSWNPGEEPALPEGGGLDSIATVIVPRARDLGGFEVRRALPAPQRQMVGPFIFFDQMGPAEFVTGAGIDVRPHPHIGLGTVTWLFEGAMWHRDSLGTALEIAPGAVNWMVAGQGISHSERSGDRTGAGRRLSGIQTWVALPEGQEDIAPAFEHHGAGVLPLIEYGGANVRLILGRAWGAIAPAGVHSDLFYADAVLAPGAGLPLPRDHEDRGVYVLSGSVLVAGDSFGPGRMMVFRPGDPVSLTAGPQGARVMLLGGATLSGPRYIWWNFVASSRERIEVAKADWASAEARARRFPLPPDDAAEHIPLPDR